MNELTELARSLGRIEEKTDHQTELLTQLVAGQADLTGRVSTLEQSRAFWKKLSSGAFAAGGFIMGLWHGSR